MARLLDRFLIKEALASSGIHIRQWVVSGGLSDHRPINLEIQDAVKKPRAPFKLKSAWLEDADYMKVVGDFWKTHSVDVEGNIVEGFSHNMQALKSLSKEWVQRKREHKEKLLRTTEDAISSLEEGTGGIIES